MKVRKCEASTKTWDIPRVFLIALACQLAGVFYIIANFSNLR
jgi:hypothetical protein